MCLICDVAFDLIYCLLESAHVFYLELWLPFFFIRYVAFNLQYCLLLETWLSPQSFLFRTLLLILCLRLELYNSQYLSNASTTAATVPTLVPMTSRDAGRIIIGTAFNSRAQEHGKSMGLKGKALHMRVKRYQDNLWRQLSKAEQAECIEAEQLSAQQLQRLNHHFDEIMEDEQNVAEDLRNFGPDSNAISVPGDTAEPLCILLICIS